MTTSIPRILFLGLGAMLLAPSFALAQIPDQIIDLTVDAVIAEDASTRITETVLYDFGPKRLHGIFRNIPLQVQEGNAIRRFGIKDISVTDRDGKAISFEEIKAPTYVRLKIGDEKVLVTGVIEYKISYTASTIMRGFTKFDEWHWDMTNSNWPVAIRRVRANITFPKAIPIQDLVRSCATVAPGDTQRKESCQVGFVDRAGDGTTRSIQMMDLNMVPKESMEIGLGFPKGFIKNVPEAKQPVNIKNPPLIQVLLATVAALLLGVGLREIVRRKWPRLIKE